MADTFGALQGAAQGEFSLKVQFNTSDVAKLGRKIAKAKYVINPALWDRGRDMANQAADNLNRQAPRGKGGPWRRGAPPLQGSHRGVMINAYYGVVYSEAPHARYIVNGFTPHMPPAEAWLGDPRLSWPMRLAVLWNGTPEVRDYFTPVVRETERANSVAAEIMADKVKQQGFDSA